MNKKIFDSGLYRESFRQLRLFGILFFVIFALEAIIIPISNVIELSSRHMYLTDLNYFGTPGLNVTENITGVEMHPILFGAIFFIAPILTLILFNFLNKRNTSDFYHSIPHTRICIFISFFTAIVTWLFIIIVGTSLISLFMHLIFSKFLIITISSWFMFTLNCFVASVLVAASVAIAVTITGSLTSNVIISGLIIFLPRFSITLITNAILSALPMVSGDHIGFLLENKYNIVTSIALSVFSNSYEKVFTDITACIYTAVLAILYILIACTLFHFRKSESASQSAPNRILQAIYRITITMVVCIFVLSQYIFAEYSRNKNIDFFTVLVAYIIAIVIYFSYELITTRKWKNLLRAIPALGIVVVLNAIIYGGMVGIYQAQLNYIPAASDISSVSIITDNNKYNNSISYNEYLDMQISKIELKNEDLIKLVAESLKDNVDTYKISRNDYYNKYINYAIYNNLCFKIKSNGKTNYRRIYIPNEDYKVINKALTENQMYKDLLLNLPKAKKDTANINLNSINYNISPEKSYEIYEELCKELKSVDITTLHNMLKGNNIYNTNIYFNTTIGLNNYKINVPIYPDLLPNTYAMIINESYLSNENERNTVIDILKSNDIDQNLFLNSYFKIYDSTTHRTFENGWGNLHDKNGINEEVLSFIMTNMVDVAITTDSSYVIINVCDNNDYLGRAKYTAIINLGELTANELKGTFMYNYLGMHP